MQSGDTIRGYELQQKIGVGGFGMVFKAHQAIIGREVAIKIIRESFANDPDFIRRFETEARIVARLEHPYIVPLYDYWREPNGAFLVMRYLVNESLHHVLVREQLSFERIRAILRQVCAALHVAHERGVVHRDIKPGNILFDSFDNAYLTDFGIAMDIEQGREAVEDNLRFATVEYTAPEQWTAGVITPRSDVYSLGILLYEMLVRETPLTSNSTKEQIEKQVYAPLPSVHVRRQDVSPMLDEVIWKATAKDPDRRYASVLAFLAALEEVPAGKSPRSQGASNAQLADASTTQLNTMDITGTSGAATQPFDTAGSPTQQFDSESSRTEPYESDGIQTQAFPAASDSNTVDFKAVMEAHPAFVPEEKRNPYKGLRSFDESDAQDFFGRDKTVTQTLAKLREHPFLGIIGPSGSGKSSLVKAGIMPRLRMGAIDGSQRWFISQMIPGGAPFQALSEALSAVAVQPMDDLATVLRDSDDVTSVIQSLLPGSDPHLVLFVDQFEEVFTLIEDETERQAFLSLLHELVTAEASAVHLILTLRADFYDRPLQYEAFGELLREHTSVLLPLSLVNLEAVIRKPAERMDVAIEPELVDKLINDVYSEPGALPLLQYTLTELYERQHDDAMRVTTYDEMGGISGALALRAQEAYDALDAKAKPAARELFLRLITIEDRQPTRRRASWQDIFNADADDEALQTVIDAFTARRLLTLDRDPTTRLPTVEIAHEAIIRAWDQLQEWIAQNQVDLRWRRQVHDEMEQWHQADRDESYLARGNRLAEWEHLLDHDTIRLTSDEREYLRQSVELRQRQARRTQIVIGVLAVLVALASGFAIFALDRQQQAVAAQATAVQERDRANTAALTAQSRELAASANAVRGDLDLSLLLGVQALAISDTYEARDSLLQALQASPFLRRYGQSHEAGIRDIAMDANGERLVSVDDEGAIWRWDVAAQAVIGAAIAVERNRFNAVAMHPDGEVVAAAGSDGVVRVWEVESGDLLHELTTDADTTIGQVWSLAFHPAGDVLAAGSAQGTLYLWEWAADDLLREVPDAHESIIYALAFHSDSERLASAGDDNIIQWWSTDILDPDADPDPQTLDAHQNWVMALAFHPTQNALASADADGRVLLWDLGALDDDPQTIGIPAQGFVRSLSFSEDGTFIAAASSQDSRLYLWNVANDQPATNPLQGHTRGVWATVFHPRELALVSAGADADLIWWSLPPPYRPAQATTLRDADTFSLDATDDSAAMLLSDSSADGALLTVRDAFGDDETSVRTPFRTLTDLVRSPDDAWVAAVADQTSLVLWDVNSDEPIIMQDAHEAFITEAIFTPQSDQLLTADEAGIVKRWALDGTLADVLGFQAQATGVSSLAINADGTQLATGGRDGTLSLWNLTDSSRLSEPLSAHENAITSLVFAHTNDRLISGSRDNRILLWTPTNDTWTPQVIGSHEDWVLDVAIRADDRLLASGSRNATVRLWDLATGRPLGQSLNGHDDWVTDVVLAADGTLVTASRNGRLVRWDTLSQAWMQQACDIARRSLNADEWERYVADRAYNPACTAEGLSQIDS